MNNNINMVSVIIPTYKRTVFYLSRAIESVLNQTYPNVEIVVIDDSPDDYSERPAVRAYMESQIQEHANIVYLQNEKNIGGSLARNRGIQVCKGDYITFLDDDDEYKPEKIAKQLDFMLKEDCDMSFSNIIMYNHEGRVVDFRSHTDIHSFDNNTLLRHHLTKKLTGTPTFMYKAEALRSIGGFDDAKHGQEFYLMLKTIKNGLSIRYLNDCDVISYRHPDGGISYGMNKITGEKDIFNCIKSHFDRLSRRERMYARFRHWAVMVVAYKRNKMYIRMLLAGITALIVSPVDFITEVLAFVIKVSKNG